MTTQVNLSMESGINVVESTMTSILRDFVRMNRLIFHRLMWERIPKSFKIRCIR